MKFRPIGDQVFVERLAPEAKAGRIFLPEDARVRPAEGVILAVGEGRRRPDGSLADLPVKPGDRVWFAPHAGADLKVGDRDLVVLGADDLLAVRA